MAENIPSGAEQPHYITDDEVYLNIQTQYDGWIFENHNDDENFQFAHTIAELVSDNFDYLKIAGSGLFSAKELPDSLQPLYTKTWCPYGETRIVMANDLTVRVCKREDHTHVPAFYSGYQELEDQGLTFQQIVDAMLDDPEFHNRVEPGRTIIDKAIIVELHIGQPSQGLEFIVEPDRVGLSIYGKVGETRDLSKYLASKHNGAKELALVSAKLAVLGAKYCLRPNNYTAPNLSVSKLDRKLLGEIGLNPNI
jgi:hypothetical protein